MILITGRLELLLGNMSSGKSSDMNNILLRSLIMGKNVQLFQPAVSIRDIDSPSLDVRGGYSILREPIADPDEIFQKVKAETDVVGLDELQIYNHKIMGAIKYLVNEGKEVFGCSIELNYRGEPATLGGSDVKIYDLMVFADKVTLYNSICTQVDSDGKVCGSPEARWVQKYYGDKVAPGDAPLVEIGDIKPCDGVWYAPRCRKHFKFYD